MLDSLAVGDDGTPRLSAYERRVFRAMRSSWDLVEASTRRPSWESAGDPRTVQPADAIIAILAGRSTVARPLEWRQSWFFGLMKLQARSALAPDRPSRTRPLRCRVTK